MRITNYTSSICRAFLLATLLVSAGSSLLAQSQSETQQADLQLPDAPGRMTLAQVSGVSSSDEPNAQTPAVRGTASISGTVLDGSEALVSGAKVTLLNAAGEQRGYIASDSAAEFSFTDLPAGIYHLTITSPGLATFVSSDLVLEPGQRQQMDKILLAVGGTSTDVDVIVTLKEQAQDQLNVEVKQRAFGFFPNFYVVYDPNFVPLTTGMKYKLAFKAATDPVTLGAAVFIAGINQAADTPSYVQGAKGFGQRVGAGYVNGVTDIMIGGAILPSLLHQDPRYFYKGTGTKKARTIHALSAPFIARGDDGRPQFNYSSVGGDLGSAVLSNIYYPKRDRGPGLVFSNALITTGGRMVNALAQELILRKFTKAKD
jgi:hypothetical protein